jgi:diguanylate cyclase (GGDEF)-like protein/PAS domain S-box-containing protein
MSERRLRFAVREEDDVDADSTAGISVFDTEIEGQQLELIYTQAPVAIGVAFVLALLVAGSLWPVADHSYLLWWLGAQVVQTVVRMGLVYSYQQASQLNRQRSRWILLFFIGTFFSGIIWGCIGLIYSFTWPVEYQTLTLMCLAGVLAGAISSYAVNLSIYAAFMVPAMLIPAQSMLIYSSKLQNNLGLMLMLFAGALLMIARNYNHNATKLLQLRQENSNLLKEMTAANNKLSNEVAVRQAAEKSLLIEQRLFTNGPVVVFRWSASDGWPIEYVSQAVSQFGYDAEELIHQGALYSDLVHTGDLLRVQESEIFAGRDGHEAVTLDYRIIGADGVVRWVYDYTIPVRNDDGAVTHYYGYLLDITERKYSEFELQQEKERVQVTLHSIADAVITTDLNGQIEYLNPSAEAMTGWDCSIARGLSIGRVFRLYEDNSHESVTDPVSQCLRTGEPVKSEGDHLLRRHDGEQLSIRYSVSPILTDPGAALGAILVFHDVTKARYLEHKVSYQATHDALTGLWNRAAFESHLAAAIETARQSRGSHVVCILDIDQLKIVNDTCSHESGDDLLKRIGALLQGSVRESDIIARLGGDEFGMLLMNCSLVSAARLMEDILVAIDALRFASGGRIFEISASIGIAQIKPGCTGTTEILSEVDLACHAAKDRGGNRYHIYQSEDAELIRRQDEMNWVSKISEAIDADRLVLYYQPIVPLSADAGQELHFEILVRMRGESGEHITPDKFLPAAERYHLITSIDRWVVTNSLAWYAEHVNRGGMQRPDTMSINLSGFSVSDAKFLGHIKGAIQTYQVPPEVLCFEITETAAVANLSAATSFIRELRQLGCRFSLDDFGSGLSSFAYLKNLPVDYLKIDGEFVREMDTDEVSHAMVSAIHELGSVIGIRTIAEFVENNRIIEMLSAMGVDYAQGYAIAKPAPLAGLGHHTQNSA